MVDIDFSNSEHGSFEKSSVSIFVSFVLLVKLEYISDNKYVLSMSESIVFDPEPVIKSTNMIVFTGNFTLKYVTIDYRNIYPDGSWVGISLPFPPGTSHLYAKCVERSFEPIPPNTYPIAFYDSNGGEIYKDLSNTIRDFDWTNTYMYKGKSFRPFDHSWQMYQSSYIIPVGETEKRTLNQIINNYYLVGGNPSKGDNMRIVIECGDLGQLDFGEIQSITDTYTSSVQSIPVAPYGFRKGFAMDLGVKRTFNVTYKRVSPENPMQPDDSTRSDYSKDSRTWSNARWIEQLRLFTDRWQMRTNGVKLYLLMPAADSLTGDMSECFPNINPNPDFHMVEGKPVYYNENWVNAYIIGSPVSCSSESTHLIESTINFQIGTIYPKATPVPMVEITLKTITPPNSKKVLCPANTYTLLPFCPSDFEFPESQVFRTWYFENGHRAGYPGDKIYVGETPFALIATTTRGHLFTYSGKQEILSLEDGAKYHILAVAGGGGGSGGDPMPIGSISGGGGASGEAFKDEETFTADGNSYIIVNVGNRGKAGMNYVDYKERFGEDGGDTVFTLYNVNGVAKRDFTLRGGRGAKWTDIRTSVGGKGWYSRGSGDGGDGVGFPTKDGKDAQHSDSQHGNGGHSDSSGYVPGGGGCNPINMSGISIGPGLQGYGGNGVPFKSGVATEKNGSYGGGGGGGCATSRSGSEYAPGNGGYGYLFIYAEE